MQKAEALPFITVEEAIKRSKLALRFQDDLGLIIWERARIELLYIRNLNEWRNTIEGKLKPIIDKVKDGTDEVILANLPREAECTSQVHQNIHNAMMSQDGAYVSLQRGIGLNKIGGSEEERLLSDIEKEFGQMNKRKQSLESEINKRKINIEKMKSVIIDYEEQLSKRSRITILRRSSRGSRKIDHLTNRLSMLRKQVEGEKAIVQKKEECLVDYMIEMKEMMNYQQMTGGSLFPGESDDEDEDGETEEEIQSNPHKRILWAAENNHLDIVETMLKSDPDLVKSCDSDMYTPLHRACYNGHVDMVKLLLQNHADIKARTTDGWQPLHSAARWNQSEVIKVLLQHGADINSQTNGGQTALHLASSCKDSRETLLVLLSNPDLNRTIKNNLGETAETICRRTSALCKLFDEIKT